MNKKIIFGELLGTFVLVTIGIGSVAVAVLFGVLNLYQIAGIWTLAVILGIYSSKKWSHAHLNLAVSVGFLIQKEINFKEFLNYLIGQFIGSVLAGLFVFFIFENHIIAFEETHEIIRGSEASKQTAMMFGEFHPNPGNIELKELSTTMGILLEGAGTFILMFIILLLVNSKKISHKITPTLIGLTVGILIIFIAPYTQAGFNPFRDFGPRLVSYFMGWDSVVFNIPNLGFLTVYIIAPIVGASLASIFYKKIS